jgi:hypothetical protein
MVGNQQKTKSNSIEVEATLAKIMDGKQQNKKSYSVEIEVT